MVQWGRTNEASAKKAKDVELVAQNQLQMIIE